MLNGSNYIFNKNQTLRIIFAVWIQLGVYRYSSQLKQIRWARQIWSAWLPWLNFNRHRTTMSKVQAISIWRRLDSHQRCFYSSHVPHTAVNDWKWQNRCLFSSWNGTFPAETTTSLLMNSWSVGWEGSSGMDASENEGSSLSLAYTKPWWFEP